MVADDTADDDDDDDDDDDEEEDDEDEDEDEVLLAASTQNLIKLFSMVRNEAVESSFTEVVTDRPGASKTFFPQLRIRVCFGSPPRTPG